MANTYFTILTDIGRAKLANAVALGRKISLTAVAVGDGGGAPVTPSGSMTKLVNEAYRGSVNMLDIDPDNPAYVVATLIIPVDTGGWYVREAGIFDDAGDMFAVGNLPESYKPVMAEGSASDFDIRLVLEIGTVSAITLKVDPSVILATRKDVNRLQQVPFGFNMDERGNLIVTKYENGDSFHVDDNEETALLPGGTTFLLREKNLIMRLPA